MTSATQIALTATPLAAYFYSLGVLLYELLTGTTPIDRKRLREAAYDEIRRIIREEEPLTPSTRMSTLGQEAASVSAQRKSDPKRLSQLFRGPRLLRSQAAQLLFQLIGNFNGFPALFHGLGQVVEPHERLLLVDLAVGLHAAGFFLQFLQELPRFNQFQFLGGALLLDLPQRG